MPDNVEDLARQIHQDNPSTFTPPGGGPIPVEWDNLVSQFPEIAESYREEARRRIAQGGVPNPS